MVGVVLVGATSAARFETMFLWTNLKRPKIAYPPAKYVRISKYFLGKGVQKHEETRAVDELPERLKLLTLNRDSIDAIVYIQSDCEQNAGNLSNGFGTICQILVR